jgi:hypothetical protein
LLIYSLYILYISILEKKVRLATHCCLGLAQGETKTRPRRKTQTRPSRPQLDPKETHSRPKGDLFATSVVEPLLKLKHLLHQIENRRVKEETGNNDLITILNMLF